MGAGTLIDSYPLRRYLLDRARGRARDYFPFIYETSITVTALNTDTIGTVDIDNDAPFLWCASMVQVAHSNGVGGVVGQNNATVQVRIGGPGGRMVTRSPTAIANMYGQRGGPFMLPAAYPIEAGSQIHVTLRSATTTGYNLNIVFRLQHVGLKVFGYGDGGK